MNPHLKLCGKKKSSRKIKLCSDCNHKGKWQTWRLSLCICQFTKIRTYWCWLLIVVLLFVLFYLLLIVWMMWRDMSSTRVDIGDTFVESVLSSLLHMSSGDWTRLQDCATILLVSLFYLHRHSIRLSTVWQGGCMDISTDCYFLKNKTDNSITWRTL